MELTQDQKLAVEYGYQNHLSQEQINYCIRPGYTGEKMIQAMNGFISGLDKEQVDLYYRSEFNVQQMERAREGFRQGLSMEQIKFFYRPEFDMYQMSLAVLGFKNGLDKEQIECFYHSGFDASQMWMATEGFRNELTVEQVNKYYIPSNSVEKMREEMMKEIGYKHGLMGSDIDEMLSRDNMIQVVGRFENEAGIPRHIRLTSIKHFGDCSYFVAGQNLDSIIPYSQMLFFSKDEELFYQQLEKRFQLAQKYEIAQKYEDASLRNEVDYKIENLVTKEVVNGGIWSHYADFSGGFEVDGKVIAQYDMSTNEIKMNGRWISLEDEGRGIEYVKDYVQRQLEYQQALRTVQSGKDVLFTYKTNGFTAYYSMGDITLEELEKIYEQAEHPYKDMPGGQWIGSDAEFAELEQSNQVRCSVTADVDNNEWTVYEINGIPEMERTDSNVSIRTVELNTKLHQSPGEIADVDNAAKLDTLAEELLTDAQAAAQVPKLGM